MSIVREAFLAGVVEGFYGRPWTHAQRLTLFERMARWGLNTYFYAPKDDLNHRALWRQSYEGAEWAGMRELIRACRDHGIRFIYGLSPGLDIRYADPEEVRAIQLRFAQLLEAGCGDFAVLFDDLPGRLSAADEKRFGSPAAAQASVANAVDAWLRSNEGQKGCFLLCPTAYCERMVSWGLGGPAYLETLGSMLTPDIDVLWTGPEIVSREISVDSIRRLVERIRRQPVIWDNLQANDYDGRRLYCGPYSGRPPELRGVVRGILSNPNNEFPVNFVPIRTLADYVAAGETWAPRASYLAALEEWVSAYATVGRPMALDDLRLLADAFYLPHEEGPEARRLVELVTALVVLPVSEWGPRHQEFVDINGRVQGLFDRLTELRDRELFYAWSRRAWDLKEELQMLEAYLAAKAAGRVDEQGFPAETHLPGTYRGGVVARLQQLLEFDPQGRLRSGIGRCGSPKHE
jgi:protein O-GlcNAcase/histone acetyltransferase